LVLSNAFWYLTVVWFPVIIFKAIAKKNFTYVSALDKDEISGLGFVEPEFPSLLAENWKENLLAHGFGVYDQNLLYREHFHKNMRYLLAFNRNLYQDQQKNRKERLQKAKEYIHLQQRTWTSPKESESKNNGA